MTAMAGPPPRPHRPLARWRSRRPIPCRTLVITSDTNFTATAGNLPDGLLFDPSKALVYGIPPPGCRRSYIVTVTATASNSPVLVKNYPILIVTVTRPAPHSAVDTTASPPAAPPPAMAFTPTARPLPFSPHPCRLSLRQLDRKRAVVSTAAAYTFTNIVNRSLVADFVPKLISPSPGNLRSLLLTWPTNFSGYTLQQNTNLNTANWPTAAETVNPVGTNYQAVIQTTNGASFLPAQASVNQCALTRGCRL